MSADKSRTLVLINPVNEAASERAGNYAPRPAGLPGKRLGLLDNSKNKAGRLLDMVAEILDKRYGFAGIVRHRKPSSARPVAPEVIKDWVKACDVAIVGVGD